MKYGLAYNTAYYGTDPDQMAAAARHAEESVRQLTAPDGELASQRKQLQQIAATTVETQAHPDVLSADAGRLPRAGPVVAALGPQKVEHELSGQLEMTGVLVVREACVGDYEVTFFVL